MVPEWSVNGTINSTDSLPWTVFMMSFLCISFSMVLKGIQCQISGRLCLHVAREPTHSLCPLSLQTVSRTQKQLCEQQYEHKYSCFVVWLVLQGSSGLGIRRIGQALIPADKSFYLVVELKRLCAEVQYHLIWQFAKQVLWLFQMHCPETNSHNDNTAYLLCMSIRCIVITSCSICHIYWGLYFDRVALHMQWQSFISYPEIDGWWHKSSERPHSFSESYLL